MASRSRVVAAMALFAILAVPSSARSLERDIVINEISYNPPDALGSDAIFEFVELHNVGDESVSLERWILRDRDEAVFFEFPPGTSLSPGEFLVIARDPAQLALVHGGGFVPIGPLPFALDNGGDQIRLLNAGGHQVDAVEYDDDLPWPEEADGEGATLERVSPRLVTTDDFTNFAASVLAPLPGTPGRPNTRLGPRETRFDVVINEIAYNPVRQAGVDPLRHCDTQEFLELHNRGPVEIDLSGWSFAAGIEFTFPAGARLEPGAYLALYSDVDAFRERFSDPRADGIPATGPYAGRLDDGGEAILLLDASGRPVDFVEYNDRRPWPINPDGIRGSLELIDAASDNDEGRSWRESEDFRGSPGAVNSATLAAEARDGNRGPSITRLGHEVKDLPGGEARGNVLSGDEVLVSARIVDDDGVARAILEYQAMEAGQYIRKIDPAFETEWVEVPMEFRRERGRHEAAIPRFPHRTLVRYRVRATDSAARPEETFAPRRGDPEPNLAYLVYDGIPDYVASTLSDFGDPGFVHTNLDRLPTYHMIGLERDVEQAQYVVRDWRDNTYRWLVTVAFYWTDPETGEVDSHVYDHVAMRLRGGVHRYHWPKRSWKLRFNRGNLFRGRFNDGTPYPRPRRAINLAAEQHNNGRPRGESGVFESLAWKLFRDSGVPGAETTFVQLRVIDSEEEHDQYEGDFFGVFLDIERIDTTFLENRDLPTDEAASLYKIDGAPQKKHPDCDPSQADVAAFISAFGRAVDREWWLGNFDVENYFSFRSVVEFSHHYDMGSKNYYYYFDTASARWMVFPWDLDNTFGSDSGNGNEPFQDRVPPRFPVEFRNRMRFLWQTLFTEERMGRAIDSWAPLLRDIADADMDRWNRGPDCRSSVPGNQGDQCGQYRPFALRMDALRNWIRIRRAQVEGLFRDGGVPAVPVNRLPWDGTSLAAPITLSTDAYFDPDGQRHVTSHWMLVEEGGDWFEPLWESITEEHLERLVLDVPGLFEIGRSYQYRVRFQDSTGRWSRLSEPTSFTVGPRDPSPPPAPAGLRALSVTPRRVELDWEPADDPESGVIGYLVRRDGTLLAGRPIEGTGFVDRLPVPGADHVYGVVAVNGSGQTSPAPARVEVGVPTGIFGGWAAPGDGFDYVFDAAPGEDAYVADKLVDGCLDGSWARSASTDNWDGSKPGEGPVPGGVEQLMIPGAAEDGGPASVLSVEDPGRPRGDDIPSSTNNRRIFLVRRFGGENPFAVENGFTLVARLRAHPAPRDVDVPSGQAPVSWKGQVGLARYADVDSRRHLSLYLDEGKLILPGVEIDVDMFEFQSVWLTVRQETVGPAEDHYRLKVYLNGSTEPAADLMTDLELPGVENVNGSAAVNYLEMGLTNSSGSGAIQIDFVAYKLGVHEPAPAGGPDGLVSRGDVDQNGRVNILDVIFTLQHVFGERELHCADSADSDDNGVVATDDALLSLRWLFLEGPAPAPPFRRCGEDPGDDDLGRCEGSICSGG